MAQKCTHLRRAGGRIPRAGAWSVHGHFTTGNGGAPEHQEGSESGAQEEDDLETAEEDAHRVGEASEQGQAAKATLAALRHVFRLQLVANDGVAVQLDIDDVIVLREPQRGLTRPARLFEHQLARGPGRGLEGRRLRCVRLPLGPWRALLLFHRGADHTRNHRWSQGLPRRSRASTLRPP